MSSDESEKSASESEHEEEVRVAAPAPVQAKPQQKKKETSIKFDGKGLDESERELLQLNKNERDKMEDEIDELRKRSEKRKKQREIEEKRLAAERIAEDEKKKSNEEARKRQKVEEDQRKQKERAAKMAEFEKMKVPQKRNFVITKKEDGEEEVETEEDETGHKSKEQQEAEKKAILKQRIKALQIDGMDAGKLAEKAKEVHSWMSKLETEKYDLDKRLKSQLNLLQNLAAKARQVNKVGKKGLKRVGDETIDTMQAKYTGAPAKVEMFSKYERQKDKRTYKEMHGIFLGPQFISPPDRIVPKKSVDWDEERMPVYSGSGSAAPPAEAAVAAA